MSFMAALIEVYSEKRSKFSKLSKLRWQNDKEDQTFSLEAIGEPGGGDLTVAQQKVGSFQGLHELLLQVVLFLFLRQVDEEVYEDAIVLQFALASRVDAHDLAVLNGVGQVRLHQGLFETSASLGGEAAVLR